MKKLLAIVIAFILCIGVIPATVQAADSTVPTYTVTLTEGVNGNYTVTASVPANVASGKIVISTSDELVLVENSLIACASGVGAENYDRDGVKGVSVSFAQTTLLSAGDVVLTATYTAKSGATIDLEDISAPVWNIANLDARLSTEKDRDVIEVYSTATLGDVNGDGYVDNADASFILKYDAGIVDFSEDKLAISDVNYDGRADNGDAALILKYDAGIVNMFCKEHAWTPATDCLHPETCTACGLTRGTADHSWKAATCSAPKTCTVCGITSGDKLAHSWTAATCNKPKTCTRCGATSGSATNKHTYVNNKCTVCGQTNPVLKNVQDYLKKNGLYSSSTNSYIYSIKLDDETSAMFSYELDEPDQLKISTNLKKTTSTTVDTYVCIMKIDPSSSTNDFQTSVYVYNYSSSKITATSRGYINPSQYSSTTKNLAQYYSTDSSTAYKNVVTAQINLTLAAFRLFIEPLGYTLADFGYTSF